MQAFITGASGFVGHHVLRAWLGAGGSARCLLRPTSPTRFLQDLEFETVLGDLTDPESLRRGAEGCDVVFHVAADYRLFARDPRTMYASNVEGTRNVLRAARDAGVPKVVYTSTVGTLGPLPDGEPADETSPVGLDHMVGHYKRSKFLGKQVAKRYAAEGAPVVIVHPSAPVGEADHKPTATGKIILDFLNRRMPAYVDTGLNLVDVRDVAQGHLLAAERGKVGEEYILGHENLSLEEILARLARLTGLAAPKVRLPHWIPMALATVDTGLSRLLPREPWLPREAVQLSLHRMYFDPAKAVAELGLPQSSVDQALERAIAWYRKHGYAKPSRVLEAAKGS